MMEGFDRSKIVALYSALADLPGRLFDETVALGAICRFAAGSEVFAEGLPCPGFPLLIEGSLKVVKLAGNGRELLLYRVRPGGSCIITSGCLLGHTAYNARGIAETPLTLLVLPAGAFRRLVAGHLPFRDYVFHLLAERIGELMQLVEEVAFARLDQRLARLLLAKDVMVIAVTHQQLADELGSVREIVSRLLKGFAAQGLVALSREQLTLVDRDGLRRLAAV